MTQFLWDTSHYDGPLSVTTLARAHADGIVALTHKISEGSGGADPAAGAALAAARDAGIPLLGGYHVVRSNATSTAQVDAFIRLTDAAAPWWRTFPGWFWQIDLERWPYDSVPAGIGIAMGKELRARTDRVVVLYASAGQYGDSLRAWDGPVWNAHYVPGAGGFRQLYPGDGWTTGWASYSGKTPDILQYSSSATIAGVTTSDISAYRGTLAELTALLTGKDTMALRDDADFLALIKRVEAMYANRPFADFKIPSETTPRHEPNALSAALSASKGTVAQIDAAAVAAALANDPTFLDALAHAIVGDIAKRLVA